MRFFVTYQRKPHAEAGETLVVRGVELRLGHEVEVSANVAAKAMALPYLSVRELGDEVLVEKAEPKVCEEAPQARDESQEPAKEPARKTHRDWRQGITPKLGRRG